MGKIDYSTGTRVLVTGGAGFIGSHLCEKLLGMGCDVTVIDIFDPFYLGKEKNAEILSSSYENSKNFHLVRGDILEFETLFRAMKDAQIVFHLAGQAGVRYCNEYPAKANLTNVNGTINVLLAARDLGVEKVVYASSSSIYGDPLKLPIGEEHPKNPNSPYGVSKLAAELYCLAFYKVYGLKTACVRYFSVYGPRGRPDQVIYAFAEKIARGETPVIFGDGTYSRDFTFVSDIVSGTLLAGEKEESNGQAFNLGFGRRITMNLLLEKILCEMNLEGKVAPIHAPNSKGDFSHTEAGNEKAKKILGWEPKVELDEGLGLFLDWFLPTRKAVPKASTLK